MPIRAAWVVVGLVACGGTSSTAVPVDPAAPAPAGPAPSSLEGPVPDPREVYTPAPPELGPVPTGEEWATEHPDAPALVTGTYAYLATRGISREYQDAHLRVRAVGGLSVVHGGRTLVLDWVVAGRHTRVELPGLVLARGKVTQVPLEGSPEAAAYLSFGFGGPLGPLRPVESLVGDVVVDRQVRGCEPTIYDGRLIVTPWLDDDGRWTAEFRDGVVDGTVMVAKLDLETGELLQCERIEIIHY